MSEKLPKQLREIVDYVIEYAGEATNDWFLIKGQIVNLFPPKERSRFSRRHYSTKKHILNSFDRGVINYWEAKTGNALWIDPGKLHPEDWEQKPHGWGLKKFNEERTDQEKSSSTD